jgi:phosphoribosyl 1,2-cyclic phosphodiesterase
VSLKIKYYGVRGSLPVSGGHNLINLGGNTTCCLVEHKGTRIVIDAGTGIRILGLDLMKTDLPKTGGGLHLLFTHTPLGPYPGVSVFCAGILAEREA